MQNQRSTTISNVSGHRCGHCSICFMNEETKFVDFTDLGIRHVVCQFSNCRMKMCVYILMCKCKLRYVGSTHCQLGVRLKEHRSRIKHSVMEASLTQHCLGNGHEFNGFRCVVLEVLSMSDSNYIDVYFKEKHFGYRSLKL